mmetsp:Transcript_40161/g.85499  ORF Transcript_40161/g.85499 Transcript_40161/m.85499 type:complete len:338 (-) Transcript_40161:146-1159(-)|eukprot:CAMPEP_0172546794 /NCGR_PEP_ID=MMETSP1067-20121228/16471_1 /TAXON_ID=265564 ORGANISM="Thalassiosira punctigera, Strain Tpunct2005C2" /NCGR_SAMPLE_ID=MMETSP1067 /ASSEMBLY_ACC=CAM_ASM_000444 /LENGTH=337 /DNA_ID=CAMNT_0013333769 /DNA_START=371 /DNA_END=1384 /DNA_ORIENTATION=+
MDGAVQRGLSNARERQRFVTILCAYVAVTLLVIATPPLKGLQPNNGGSTRQGTSISCTEQHNTDDRPPIMKSVSRGFRPIYVFSKTSPPIQRQYSQSKQDVLVMALTKTNNEVVANAHPDLNTTSGKMTPYFVDLAANHAVQLSNTLLLEKNGWEGLCLEPNPMYWYGLASFRTCTVVGAFVGGTPDEDGKKIDVILSNGVFGGIVGEGMDNTQRGEEKRNLVSIAKVFKETNVPVVIDYLSLDVEGAELLVMQNFPWEQYKFKFMTIERPKDVLVDLLGSHGYKKVMTIADFGEILFYHTEEVALSDELIKMVALKLDIKDYTGPWDLPGGVTAEH